MPDAVPDDSVSLDKDAAAARKKTEDAGMDKPAAQLVQSGPIAEARAAQGELDQAAKEDPAQVLAKQQEALGKADADMAGAADAGARGAHRVARRAPSSGPALASEGMVGTEEQMRAKAGAEAKAAFDEAQSAVKALLKNLAPNAMAKWEAAKTVLTTQFKNDLTIVKERVDERHSGVSGFVVGLWDAVTGLPGWATDAYDKAEKNFADGVIDKLTRDLGRGQLGHRRLRPHHQGRARAHRQDLRRAAGLAAGLGGARNRRSSTASSTQLHNEVIAARDAFNKDLIERASQAVDEVRAEIAELRKKAGGLIGRIVAAVEPLPRRSGQVHHRGAARAPRHPAGGVLGRRRQDQEGRQGHRRRPDELRQQPDEGAGPGLFASSSTISATHLIKGFLSWLLGDLKGVQIPKDFSLKSIVTFFLQMMGITWPNIRKILAKQDRREERRAASRRSTRWSRCSSRRGPRASTR